MKKYNVAVGGATGLVGQMMLKVLEERKFPVDNLYPMASFRSAGKTVQFGGKDYVVEELKPESFDKDIDIALFSAGGGTSEKFAPEAAKRGVIVIDNSSAWRMDPTVPLVVPVKSSAWVPSVVPGASAQATELLPTVLLRVTVKTKGVVPVSPSIREARVAAMLTTGKSSLSS